MSERTWRIYDSVDQIDGNQYRHLLEQSETASIHHHPGWLGALERGLDKEPRHVVVEDGGNPVGALPNFLDPLGSTPFARLVSVNPGRGGPVLSTTWEPVLDRIFEALNDLMDWRIVEHELRTDVVEQLSLAGYVEEQGYEVSVGGKFVLRLDGSWDEVLDSMHKDRRYDIRKATETDHEVRELELSPENVADFYSDYCRKMGELGTPRHPRTFFDELVEGLEDRLVLVTNVADGERRGYHLYLMDDFTSTIRHYMMTVTRDDYEYYSGELLHRHMIKRGLEKGWDRYDFGGRDIDFRDGGFKYKAQFGGDLVGSYRWRLQRSKPIQIGRRVARSIR